VYCLGASALINTRKDRPTLAALQQQRYSSHVGAGVEKLIESLQFSVTSNFTT